MADEITLEQSDLEQFDPQQFAELIANAKDGQLREVIEGPMRKQVLDEIFGRMAEHVEPSQIDGLDTVVHFKILDRPEDQGGGYDHYEVVFRDGACEASDSPTQDPKVTIKTSGVQFLKLAAGKASGPVLFMTGKLKLEGDVMLASRLTSFFRIPSAG
jgi:putative sterol carrier protein